VETEIHRILVIDDNPDYRKLLLVRLNGLFPNADIREYDILKHGLPPAKFDWEKFDVLILDYHLGEGETGLDWFKRYKKSEYFPATVIVTGVHDEDTVALILNIGVHYYLNKKQLTKNKMYEGIEKALAVRASLIAEYKSHSSQEYDYDAFLTGYLIRIKERLIAEILSGAKITGSPPNEQLIDTVMERELQNTMEMIDDATIREAKIDLLEVVAEDIKYMSW